MVFEQFAANVAKQFENMTQHQNTLYVSNLSKDQIWELYLESIPKEHNPIFRTRRLYDGQYDKQFIRRIGRLLTIKDNQLVSVWDVEDDSFFGDVAKRLSKAVKEAGISHYFSTNERTAGHRPNADNYDANILWTHFYAEIPNHYLAPRQKSPSQIISDKHSLAHVLQRSFEEVSLESLDTVIDLINENALYRGQEHLHVLTSWREHLTHYQQAENKSLYVWDQVDKAPLKFKNTVIGTLVTDIENGVALDVAVRSFEAKVAPSNYKRTTSIVTAKMVEQARNVLSELGLIDSLNRRFATEADIPREHVLFKSQTDKALDVFDDLIEDANLSTKNVDTSKATDIKLDDFLKQLPTYKRVELLPLRTIHGQKMVMTTSVSDNTKPLFKWKNPFAWAYTQSDTADAIKERVKEMGGNVDADVRVSLSWHTEEDLDLHAVGKRTAAHISYRNKRDMGGYLDLDMNGLDKHDSENPVENLIWEKARDFKQDVQIAVDHYRGHNNDPSRYGFDIQVEIEGSITTYRYEQRFDGAMMPVLTLKKKDGSIVIDDVHQSLVLVSHTTFDNRFINVDSILLSPNHWDGAVGNKHVFFMTTDFDIHAPVRSFFNEYLSNDLMEHRKVFEILGHKTKLTENAEHALRGYGFSSTMDNQLIIRVTSENGRRQLLNISVK